MKIKNEALLRQTWLLPLCSCFVLLFLARQIHHALQQHSTWALGAWIALGLVVIVVNIVLTRASMRSFQIGPGQVEIEYVSGKKVQYAVSEDRVLLSELPAGKATLFRVEVKIGKSLVPIAYFPARAEAEEFRSGVAALVGGRGESASSRACQSRSGA